MMNVRGIRYLLLFLFSTLVISGCEDPEVSVDSLGKKFQAPKLTGTSPFDQNMKTSGYVRFQGSCNPRVTDISISFDNKTWFIVPAAPITTGTTLSGSEVNDGSCETDGLFDFYLTNTDLTNWGYDPNVDVNTIYIRGNSVIGETHTLSIQDPSPGSGPGGGNTGVATQVMLEKTWPTGFAGSGQCEYFSASVRDANGHFTTTAANVTFSLDKKVASTVSSTIVGYDNQADCVASTNSKTSFTILGGKNSQFVYYRMPDAPIGGTISFRASDVSLATTTSAYIDISLRDSTSALYWISSFSPYKIGKGMCTRANFDARLYNGSWKSPIAWIPNVTGTNASNLHFYSDANCGTEITNIDGTNGNAYYIKYTGIEVSTSNIILTISHTVDTATFGAYDDISQKIEIDRSGNTTLAHFDFYIQDSVSRATCNQTQLQAFNSQGTLVTPNITVNFASSAGATFYANQSDCDTDNNRINQLAITNPQTPLYYRVTGAPGTNQTFTFTSTGLNSAIRTFSILNKATTVTALFNGSGQTEFTYPVANICTAMVIEAVLSDSANDGTVYVNNFGENKSIGITIPTGYTLYSEATCTTQEPGNSIGVSVDKNTTTSGQVVKYIKANSTPAAGNFYVNQTVGGATGYLMSTMPNLILGP